MGSCFSLPEQLLLRMWVERLPELMSGKDAYLHAATGTGKTLAYLLPIFARLDAAQAATQAVIVAPTHELAL